MDKYRVYYWINPDEMKSLVVGCENSPTFYDGRCLYINDTEFIDFTPFIISMVETEDPYSICDDCDVADPKCNKCLGS
jgi:hypothetical protein